MVAEEVGEVFLWFLDPEKLKFRMEAECELREMVRMQVYGIGDIEDDNPAYSAPSDEDK